MGIIATDKVGWEILELLGINTKNAREATIKIKPYDIMTVEVLYLATDNRSKFVLTKDGMDIKTVLKKFELKEIK